ncbi:MAG TPA: recombination protein RecR [Elusimicrobia bacterium]|nr:MAG: recombination protein RecR [Elusimicrobia bacterium GWA2_66_18]OGR69017.1 MAG: recombination protein RecR [Elusimicrobia bacterium GWC2_65_9]HAZ07064.1 recombination protein RecR [Elusimicrobiota bacterium]
MKSLERLIAALKRLPGVGPKQAERLTLHILRSPRAEVENLVETLLDAKDAMRFCARCGDFTDREVCKICSDPGRDQALLCVVEEPQDAAAFERSRAFHGLYHILHGSLSPLDGVGPERIKVRELIDRLKAAGGCVREVILATDPDTEGEATALYLGQILKSLPVKITRIAHGVPMGGDLDYMDERTLSHALTGRREF